MRNPFRRAKRFYYRAVRRPHGGLVLMYHRVAELAHDPQLLCVTPSRFQAQLQVLDHSGCHVLPLPELVGLARRGKLPPKAVAITFDDGYADNLQHAQGALAQYAMPATFFIVSDSVGMAGEFFWDELAAIFLEGAPLPDELALTINGQALQWGTKSTAEDGGNWHVRCPTATPLQQVYMELCELLRPLPFDEREAALESIARWSNVPRPRREAYRALTHPELRQLADSPNIIIGAHTAHHPMLAALNRDNQYAEIVASQERLETWLNAPVRTFSYPFGWRGAYTDETLAIVRECFDVVCTTLPAPMRWDADPHQVPRYAVRDWDTDEFAGKLQTWLSAAETA